MANIYVWAGGYALVTQWSANTPNIAVGMIRRQLATPALGSERCFRCSAITTGITGSTEPNWNLTANATTTDGGVTWTECTGQALYNGDGGGTAWGAPFAKIVTANSFSAAGDTIFLSSKHAESGTNTITLNVSGTSAARTRMLSVDETVVPSSNLTTLKDGAAASNNNSSSNIQGTSTTGYGGFFGLTYAQANTAGLPIIGNGYTDIYFESCHFQLTSASGTAIQLGQNGTATSANRVRWKNSTVKFAATGQYLSLRAGQFILQGLALEAGSSIPTTFLRLSPAGTGATDCLILDSDLSNINTTLFDLNVLNNNFVSLRLVNCKLHGSVILPTAVARPGYRFRMDNCDSGATNYRFYQLDFFGYVQHETSIDINGLSAKITTLTTSAWEAPLEFSLPPVYVVANVPQTYTAEIAGSVQLTNAQAWIELDYLGTSGAPLGTIATSGTSSMVATGTTIPASTATWGGTPQTYQQKITVSVTPVIEGWIQPTIKVARPSTVLYVDLGAGKLLPGTGFINSPGLFRNPGMEGGLNG